MALVDDQQIVLREIVDQAERPAAGRAAVEIARIVFDAGAVAQLLDHFQIVLDALLQPPRLGRLAERLEILDLGAQIELNLPDRLLRALARRDEQVGRIDDHAIELLEALARMRVDRADHFDFVVEENHPVALVPVGDVDVYRIAVHAERTGLEIGLAARVERVHEAVQQLVAADHVSQPEFDGRGVEILGVPDTVDARYARHDDDIVAPAEQSRARAEAHFFDFVVDRQVFLDKRIGRRNIGLGLVIVVVGDEILDGVLGEEILEFAVQLGRQRLVVAHDQRRFVQRRDHVGHRERLARTGDPEQRVVLAAAAQRVDELRDRLGLVAGRLVLRNQFEIHVAKLEIYVINRKGRRKRIIPRIFVQIFCPDEPARHTVARDSPEP